MMILVHGELAKHPSILLPISVITYIKVAKEEIDNFLSFRGSCIFILAFCKAE